MNKTIINPFIYLFVLHSTIFYDLFPNKFMLWGVGCLLGFGFLLFQAEYVWKTHERTIKRIKEV